jgi:hypothetical protein
MAKFSKPLSAAPMAYKALPMLQIPLAASFDEGDVGSDIVERVSDDDAGDNVELRNKPFIIMIMKITRTRPSYRYVANTALELMAAIRDWA